MELSKRSDTASGMEYPMRDRAFKMPLGSGGWLPAVSRSTALSVGRRGLVMIANHLRRTIGEPSASPALHWKTASCLRLIATPSAEDRPRASQAQAQIVRMGGSESILGFRGRR